MTNCDLSFSSPSVFLLSLLSPSKFAPSISSFAKHASFCHHSASADVTRQWQIWPTEEASLRFPESIQNGVLQKYQTTHHAESMMGVFCQVSSVFRSMCKCVLDQFTGMVLMPLNR